MKRKEGNKKGGKKRKKGEMKIFNGCLGFMHTPEAPTRDLPSDPLTRANFMTLGIVVTYRQDSCFISIDLIIFAREISKS